MYILNILSMYIPDLYIYAEICGCILKIYCIYPLRFCGDIQKRRMLTLIFNKVHHKLNSKYIYIIYHIKSICIIYHFSYIQMSVSYVCI